MTTTYYVPGTQEKDPSKVIMSLQQAHEKTATNTTNIATNTADIATNTADIATNSADIAALQAAGYVVGPASATDNALVRFDATTGKLVQNSDITLGDSDGKLTRTAGISLSGTNTNDSAAAGYVGEYLESNIALGSAVSLTSGNAANVTSRTFEAGDWDIGANVTFNPAATTNVTLSFFSISETSATQDTTTGGAYNVLRYPAGNVPVAGYTIGAIGPIRKSFTSTTTVYLVAQATFTVSTMSAYGILRARRAR
jgi:hypothetical protein